MLDGQTPNQRFAKILDNAFLPNPEPETYLVPEEELSQIITDALDQLQSPGFEPDKITPEVMGSIFLIGRLELLKPIILYKKVTDTIFSDKEIFHTLILTLTIGHFDILNYLLEKNKNEQYFFPVLADYLQKDLSSSKIDQGKFDFNAIKLEFKERFLFNLASSPLFAAKNGQAEFPLIVEVFKKLPLEARFKIAYLILESEKKQNSVKTHLYSFLPKDLIPLTTSYLTDIGIQNVPKNVSKKIKLTTIQQFMNRFSPHRVTRSMTKEAREKRKALLFSSSHQVASKRKPEKQKADDFKLEVARSKGEKTRNSKKRKVK